MRIASNWLRFYHRNLSYTTSGLALCLVCSAGMAAEAARAPVQTFSTPSPDDKTLGLKLDLGPAMGDDDCEEDYADLMAAAAAAGGRTRPAEALRPAVSGTATTAAAAAPVAFPAAAPAVPAAPVAPPAPAWEVTLADKTLNTVLARWAAVAGWQLVWELPVDYAVSVRTEVRGSFSEAVGAVAKSMASAEIPMKAIFYEGNRVLRIVAKGSE